ncbi:MAG: hypothetical protein COA45_06445 [Zetaproteobacteria bacterium]|nr:MAG: hypothetical protein COA45_06445 [Zetaproteobacteria bacterium]
MSLVTSDKFTHDYMRRKEVNTLTLEQAENSNERELHIAVINAMPEGAVRQTPSQLAGPMAEAAGSRNVVLHTFYVDDIDYGAHTQYVIDNYHHLDKLDEIKPDIIIVSGSGDYDALLPAVKTILEHEGATTKIFSCMAGHALFEAKYDTSRQKLDEKKHGIFPMEKTNITSPLTKGISSNFNEPFSRWYDISWEQVLDADMKLLIDSADNGVFLASSKDGISEIFIQGHPEYSKESLLREFNRDTICARFSEITHEENPRAYPKCPENYLISKTHNEENNRGLSLVENYIDDIKSGTYDAEILKNHGAFKMPDHIEKSVMQSIPDTSASVTYHLFANIIKTVFEVTHFERGKPFMDELDPKNPCRLPEGEPLQSTLHLSPEDLAKSASLEI